MTNSSGTIVARYDYDSYGRVTVLIGTTPSDRQYAGMYAHQPSKLNLTLYRAYDPNTARWLSRDPEGEGSDATLYSYCANCPVDLIDVTGLSWVYYQSLGQLDHIDDSSGQETYSGTGYSGDQSHCNKPDAQNLRYKGPIPQGNYTIGSPAPTGPGTNLPNVRPPVLPLTPNPGTNTFDRNDFYMHGGKGGNDHTASQGCIIMDKPVRQQVATAVANGDNQLKVVK